MMNSRDFMEAVAASDMADEIKDFAREALVKMDATNEKRKARAAEKRAEKEAEKAPIRAAVLACITDEPKTATQLIDEAGVDITRQSVPSLLKPLVEDGTIEKVEVPVKGKPRGYVLAAAADED